MKLLLKRKFYSPTYTIGNLFINGVLFCNTLEDPKRDVKIQNETCIPTGTYKVILNYSQRFKRIMPLLLDVPNFTGIRIHSGNTAADTSGCILVGINNVKGQVINSRFWYNKLFSLLTHDSEGIEIKIE